MGWTDVLVVFFVGVAIAGSFYNATLRIKLSYAMWLASNTFLCAYNLFIGEYAQGLLFGVNLITTLVGIKNTYGDKYWFKPRNQFS
jgi:hypothetical protein